MIEPPVMTPPFRLIAPLDTSIPYRPPVFTAPDSIFSVPLNKFNTAARPRYFSGDLDSFVHRCVYSESSAFRTDGFQDRGFLYGQRGPPPGRGR